MNQKIIYYLGAGASAGAIPVVNKINDRIDEQQKLIKIWLLKFDYEQEIKHFLTWYEQLLLMFVNDLKQTPSIDTLAKVYLYSNPTKYQAYNNFISYFFAIEEFLGGIDKRYLGFIAGILNGSNKNLNEKILVYSWNYDLQFERAYSIFLSDSDKLHGASLPEYYLNRLPSQDFNPLSEKFSLIKLNGTLGYLENKTKNFISIDFIKGIKTEQELLLSLFNLKIKVTNKPESFKNLLRYSWEFKPNSADYSNFSSHYNVNLISPKEVVLVVIGYSFPFFNREIDKRILGSLKLNKVYIQAPNEALPGIKSSFRSIKPEFSETNIELINSIDSFFIAPQL